MHTALVSLITRIQSAMPSHRRPGRPVLEYCRNRLSTGNQIAGHSSYPNGPNPPTLLKYFCSLFQLCALRVDYVRNEIVRIGVFPTARKSRETSKRKKNLKNDGDFHTIMGHLNSAGQKTNLTASCTSRGGMLLTT